MSNEYRVPERPPVHPRGRLREVLRQVFWPQFGAVGRPVPRKPGERIYKWHLQEARILSQVHLARSLNNLADRMDEELPEGAAILRAEADRIEDEIDTIEVELG